MKRRSTHCSLCGRRLSNKGDEYLRKWEYDYCSIQCYKFDQELIPYEEELKNNEEIDIPEELYDLDMDNDIFKEPFDDMDDELL